jgi:hypothetical protein
MSIGSDDVDTVAGQLLYTAPFVYFNNVDDDTASNYQNLKKVFNKEWVSDPGTNVAEISAGQTSFQSLAKNGAWGKDLYEFLVAPTLRSDLLVESWMRGEKVGSYCRPEYPYDVTDIGTCAVSSPDGAIEWKETQDHAKWCVALDTSKQLCVCGINRMTSQRTRGGGCVCFTDAGLSSHLNATITSAWSC